MRRRHILPATAIVASLLTMLLGGCAMKENNARNRWWHSFNARYNTYFNGSQAYIEGSIEKENSNNDNFTEMLPLYVVGNKKSRDVGKGKFERAIEKAQKAIKLHSIKERPKWTKNRKKTPKDIEWLSRREYNPFLWKAWLMMGKSQFQMGKFDEAAATFSYMSRLYDTQPEINGIARAWLAISYAELDWLYDAEDVIVKMRRDTMHYKAARDWDYALADYYIRRRDYPNATSYLRKVIRHEKRRKLKARQWYLMGQMYAAMGDTRQAYKAFGKTIRQNPPYNVEFNARIAQTEVMAGGKAKKMIRRLRRMAASDKNKDYLDQVYYAIGNIYLAQKDTSNAISAYERGNKESTRSGVEKGVLLLKLGNLYWQWERYNDAQRCYGEAIGLLDKERDDYAQLSRRSKILDDLVPHTDAIHLQDSLQVLAGLPEKERNEAIDRVIEELIRQEKEAKRAAQEAEAEKVLAEQGAVGNRENQMAQNRPGMTDKSGVWYFYNQMAVNQGKTAFQRQWGKRENTDDWRRINRTVVRMNGDGEVADSTLAEGAEGQEMPADSIAAEAAADTTANDPHKREYYLAQIPFTEEQKAASDAIIMEALFNSGVIFKDKLDNLPLSRKAFERLTTQYAQYEKNDEAWYHMFLMYSRMGRHDMADNCIARLKADYPESKWTILLSDPYFAENARFGVHIEDSLYGATYNAFKADRYSEVKANARISEQRFPLGYNRPKFIFIEGLGLLNDGDAEGCVAKMKEVVEKYSDSEVSPMAGMIIRGVQEGRTLYGGKFDMGDVWSRRSADMAASDSTAADTLSVERNTGFVFMLAYQADSINANQLLYELAKFNFTNYLVRNFDIATDADQGISRMMVTGFLNYDEALQYARQLYADEAMAKKLEGCRRIIISQENLPLLGTRFSYVEYEKFFDDALAPIKISEEPLLEIPEKVVTEEEPDTPEEEEQDDGFDDLFNDAPQNNSSGTFDFEEEFYQ